MALIQSFRDLDVYKLGREQSRKIFAVTRSFPREERFSLTDQIRRSSRAVGAIIAEGWAKRKYPDAFVYKLYDAMGESMETQSWLDQAYDCDYIDHELYCELNDAWQHIGAMLNRMIERAGSFCGQ
ncbi:MAG TPA: four helix bundle protein [Gemmataceae bacterium]|jgi:four helix bundle protein|nr:four helix bundle protein [Gemmataceae bacterium]